MICLDAGELLPVAFGEPLGVHPEREAGALEFSRESGLAGFASVVPDVAADLVERVGRELDHVERVQADLGVRAALGDGDRDPVGHVAGHQLDLLAAVVAQQIQELVDRLLVAAGVRPHQPAGVVVDHDREVSLTFANRDLIHARRLSPENRSRCAWASAATRSQIQPTVRHAIRISSDTAVLVVLTVSHAV